MFIKDDVLITGIKGEIYPYFILMFYNIKYLINKLFNYLCFIK
jgi:hypothetical protein